MDDKAKNTIKIALIDDDPSVRSGVSRLLRSHDHSCKTYESAESALADSDLPRVDCLLLDVQLSGMNGFALRDSLLRAEQADRRRARDYGKNHQGAAW